MFRRARPRLACWFFLLPLLLGLRATAFAQTDLTIYDEALAPGWQNWSWATVDHGEHGANANTGAVSIAVTPAALLGALSALCRRARRHSRLSESHFLCPRRNRRRADLPGPAMVSDVAQAGCARSPLAAGTWQKITVPLATSASTTAPMSMASGSRRSRASMRPPSTSTPSCWSPAFRPHRRRRSTA